MTEEDVLGSRQQLDWHVWHTDYDDPASGHSQRLATVQRLLVAALDAAPAGPVAVLSLYRGTGPRRHRRVARSSPPSNVRARLVWLDADLADQARAAAASAGLDNVEVVTADAGSTNVPMASGPPMC